MCISHMVQHHSPFGSRSKTAHAEEYHYIVDDNHVQALHSSIHPKIDIVD